MRDEIDARLWNEHHTAFSDSITAALETVMASLYALNRIQFDAPWRRVARRRRRA